MIVSNQKMQVTGEEGISDEDFVAWQKSLLLDMVYFQQDAFDEIDACMPRERQLVSFRLLKGLIDTGYRKEIVALAVKHGYIETPQA